MVTETEQILKELKEIRADLDFIKVRIKDVDIMLTDDDVESIRNAEKDLKEGRTKRLV
ncbi:MAG: hypothetical protein HYY37_00530 [Candidatus Aenigmarchaeota archaeon]|nr:hypothetical protein [Candidatus Aenigmarchaeota archaeon]